MAAPRVALRGNVMASSRKKIYIFKKLALSKKQNKTTVTKKNKQKGKKKRKEEKKKKQLPSGIELGIFYLPGRFITTTPHAP